MCTGAVEVGISQRGADLFYYEFFGKQSKSFSAYRFGTHEVLGFGLYKNESRETWTAFLSHLKKRGLKKVLMITSDVYEGIVHAMTKVFPEVSWQRCQFHFIRNILDKTAKKYQSGLQTELQEMFHSATMEKARARRDAFFADYSDVAEEAMRCLEEGFESAMIVMHLDEYLRRYYRTSNHLERLNKELKRRSKVISIFPNGDSVIRLMGSVLVEHHNACQAKRKIFSPENYQKLMNSGTRLTLIHVAQQQRQLLVA